MRRNPLADSDDLAQRLYDSSFSAVEISLSDVNLSTADRGHPVVDEPERYRWFLISEFPVNAFGLRLEDLTRDTSDPGHERHRHDKIVGLLRAEPAWPSIVTADGVLVDGFHRVTANRTLGRRFMPVVVAVDSSGTDQWSEMWLEAARHTNPPFAGFSDLVRHYYGQGMTVPQIVAKINDQARRPVSASSVLDALRRANYYVPPERMEAPHRMNPGAYEIEKTFSFDSAHFLPKVPKGHKCGRMHGHTYNVIVGLKRDGLAEEGWVLDYGDVSKVVKPIIERLDHQVLNEIEGLENPTAEQIASWLYDRLDGNVPFLDSVVVKETPGTAARYRKNDGSDSVSLLCVLGACRRGPPR